MYCIVWKYGVDKSSASKFEEEYSRSGSWFKFFEPCDDFLGHDLLKAADGTYLIIDKWMGKKDYDSFVKSNQIEYSALEDKTKELYQSEEKIGEFEAL